MKLTILGSCSGTEPMPGRRHTSFVVEHNSGVYWFDAGEGCSHTAHVMGIDIMAISALFISHTHLDHVGGLVNLLGTMRKLESRNNDPGRSLQGKTVPVFIPNLSVWEGALAVLSGPADTPNLPCRMPAQTYTDGVIFEQKGLKVFALHNRHLGQPESGAPWLSKPRREQYRALYRLLDDIDIPLPELALRFVLSNADVHTVLSGARSATEVELNVAAAEQGPLPDELLSRIADVAAMVPFRPHDEPFALPFGCGYPGSPAAGPI